MAMLYGLQLLQGLSLAVLPSSETIRMPTMNYSSGRTWTRKLNVSGKTKKFRLNHQCALCFELLSHIQRPRVLLSRGPFCEHSLGSGENKKAIG